MKVLANSIFAARGWSSPMTPYTMFRFILIFILIDIGVLNIFFLLSPKLAS